MSTKNPKYNRDEQYVRTTAARMLTKLKLNINDYTKEEDKEYAKVFEKLSFEEKIDIVYNIISTQDIIFKRYILEFKNFHLVGFGSLREMRNRRYSLRRAREIQAQFPDMPREDIHKTIKQEIRTRKLREKNLRKRKYYI